MASNQGSYPLGSNFTPFTPNPNGDPNTVLQQLQDDNNTLKSLTGFSAVYYFYTVEMPEQLTFQSACMIFETNQISDLNNYSAYTTMLKTEFTDCNPQDSNYNATNAKNYSDEFLSQLKGVLTALSSDTILTPKTATTVSQPLDALDTTITNLNVSLSTIWTEANNTPPTQNNASNLQTILESFSVETASTQTLSQGTENEVQFFINSYNQILSSAKQSISAFVQSGQFVDSLMTSS